MDRRPIARAAWLLLVGSVVLSSVLAGCTTTAGLNPPGFLAQPQNVVVSLGQPARFSVTAAGTPPLTYQWQKNGMDIAGATSPDYMTPPTTAADNGATFRVTVTNSGGSLMSNPATLTLNAVVPAGTDVTTYKNDLARTGQNLTEKTLTTTNVNFNTFGLLRNLMVMGKVDAQPLYLSQLMIQGALHNVVFVATERDQVYAFDADTGATLWNVSMLVAGETTSDVRNCSQVDPEIGVTATPVIDRNAGPHGAIFVVAMSKDGAGKYHQRLHALDLTTGGELFTGPKEVQATFPNVGGVTPFDPGQYKERPGLLLLNGEIYTSWSSHCDIPPYTGWIISYNETTLARNRIFNIAPNSSGNGPSIWMSGGAPAVDSSGNILLLAANGVFEESLIIGGFPSQGDYGNAFLKLSTANNSLAVADYFVMHNQADESSHDTDLGSGGAMVLPDLTDGVGTVRHLAVGAGKDGNIYVVERNNMGKFSAASNNIWQEIDGKLPGGIWSTPAYFNQVVYFGNVGGTLKAFTITQAKLSAAPAFQSGNTFAYPGTAPAISANGSANGIVWAAENNFPAILHAYNAADLSELYNSSQAPANRDQCGNGNKFITPTIADGKVFLGTQTSVCVFGLLH